MAKKNQSKKAGKSKKDVAQAAAPAITSESPAALTPPMKEKTAMTLSLKGLDKRGRNAIYTGSAVALRIPIGAFPDKNAPPTLTDLSQLAGPRQPKAKMTPEERKAARAAQPKLTLAEKVAKAEERAAKLREKLAKAAPAAM